MKILLIEDDREMSDALAQGLAEEGLRLDTAFSYREGLLKAEVSGQDVLVVDVMLPGGSGIDLCRHLRERGIDTPVLFLTALGGEDDRLDGFRAGGDDYLTKPFSFQELLARLRALARRSPELLHVVKRIADLEVDLDAHTASRGGSALSLTAQEWALLEFFVRHENTVLSRAEITAYVWDDNHDPFTNLLEVLVWRLRKKVDEGSETPLIHTVRGAGYRFGV